jgi:Smg protein
MFDILVYLFENYVDFADFSEADPQADSNSGSALSHKLTAAGFAEEEITEALSWLRGLQDNPSLRHLQADGRSLRAYTAEESSHLGVEALGFLHFLEQAEVLSTELRELVIERAMALPDDGLSLARFKLIVLMVLWSRQQHLDALIVEELLSDSAPEHLH